MSARVVPATFIPRTLAPPSRVDAFVTAWLDISMYSAVQISQRLEIASHSSYKVLILPISSLVEDIATPIRRNSSGFVGGGRTSGGAREFVVPNQPVPSAMQIRRVT